MPRWNKIRPAILLAMLALTLGALAKGLLSPVPLEIPLPAFAFPAESPIPGWSAAPSDNPALASYETTEGGAAIRLDLRYIADVRAFHLQDENKTLVMRMLPPGNLALDVKMHHIVDAAGRIQSNENGQPFAPNHLDIHRMPEGNSFGLWQDGHEFHLAALLGANGRTVATSRGLMLSVYLPQFTLPAIARALFSEKILPDKRCILADLTLLTPGLAPDDARNRLRQAWTAWDAWFAPRFVEACARGR